MTEQRGSPAPSAVVVVALLASTASCWAGPPFVVRLGFAMLARLTGRVPVALLERDDELYLGLVLLFVVVTGFFAVVAWRARFRGMVSACMPVVLLALCAHGYGLLRPAEEIATARDDASGATATATRRFLSGFGSPLSSSDTLVVDGGVVAHPRWARVVVQGLWLGGAALRWSPDQDRLIVDDEGEITAIVDTDAACVVRATGLFGGCGEVTTTWSPANEDLAGLTWAAARPRSASCLSVLEEDTPCPAE